MSDKREYLHTLPPEHPDRNRPLVGAHYGPKSTAEKRTGWKSIAETYRIASSTFNQLGPSWTDHDYWSFEP